MQPPQLKTTSSASPQTPHTTPRDRPHTFLDSPDSSDDDDDEDDEDNQAAASAQQAERPPPADDDSDTEVVFPALSLPRLDLEHQTEAELETHDQAMRQLIQTFYRDLLQQIRHRQEIIDTSLAVIPSLRQQMSDLDHRIHRHESYLHEVQSQFNRYKRTLLRNLNKFIPVFADLQRRQDERTPKPFANLSVEQRYNIATAKEDEEDAKAAREAEEAERA